MNTDQIVKDIAQAFLTEKLVHRDVRGSSISELAINFNGVRVFISWFAFGKLHMFKMNGMNSLSSSEIEPILEAAKKRADGLAKEDLERTARELGYGNDGGSVEHVQEDSAVDQESPKEPVPESIQWLSLAVSFAIGAFLSFVIFG